MDISVVVPVYNEEGNLPLLTQRLEQVLRSICSAHEILLVNDGSRDASLAIMRKLASEHPAIRYIDLSRNFGHQIAVTAGLDHARGQAVVIIDADLQDPPEVIAQLYQKLQQGYEVVYARRIRREGESWFKKWTAKMFYRLLNRMTSIDIPLDTGDFRIMDRKVVDALKAMPEHHKFLRGQIAWVGFRQAHVDYERSARHAGETGYPFRKMLRFALDGMVAFSDIPLRLVTWFGIIVSVLAFGVGVYTLYARLIGGEYVPGWASIMVSVLFIGGVQMLALGIIGEYLSRMQADVRDRPLYLIRESNVHQSEGRTAQA